MRKELVVERYSASDEDEWEDLTGRASCATFLHTRRFLSYHEDRFEDVSLVLRDGHGRVRGVLPAAEQPMSRRVVVSHPGATYGGLVHDGSLVGAGMVAALREVAGCLRSIGYDSLRYKATPFIYARRPASDDLFALAQLGAVRTRCQLSATIDLTCRGPIAHGRRDGHRKAIRAGVDCREAWSDIHEFWPVLVDTLSDRHGAAPVHTLRELCELRRRFPDDLELVAARIDGAVVAGAVVFRGGPTLHLQYTGATELGRANGAMDLVLETCISLGSKLGCRYFDFGTNDGDRLNSLNESLYAFKASFGASGVVYETYDLSLA